MIFSFYFERSLAVLQRENLEGVHLLTPTHELRESLLKLRDSVPGNTKEL